MNCSGDHRGKWDINGTQDSDGLGPLHPRPKIALVRFDSRFAHVLLTPHGAR